MKTDAFLKWKKNLLCNNIQEHVTNEQTTFLGQLFWMYQRPYKLEESIDFFQFVEVVNTRCIFLFKKA